MKTEKKFFLDAIDGLDTAKECILADSEESLVILNIPKDSVLVTAAQNFRELKKIAVKENKELVIESSDGEILELASLSGIRVINTSYHPRERAVSDILPRTQKTRTISEKTKEREKEIPVVTEMYAPEERKKPDVSIIFERKENEEKRKEKKGKIFIFRKKKKEMREVAEEEEVGEERKEKRGGKRGRIVLLAIVLLLVLGAWGASVFLPRANVTLVMKKASVPFEDTLVITTKITSPDISNKERTSVPGELLSAKKNMLLEFDAEARENVSYKAKGILTVSNAYSASPQTLVATTRFESPDGKIFRLDEKTVVPGAKISGGKTTPSSVDVKVTADAPGAEWNVAPAKDWKIPGFKGTPRYDTFTAENTKAMSGGFVGEMPVVSETQKQSAAEDAGKSLKDVLNGEMFVLMSDTFKLLPGGENFEITKNEYQEVKNNPNKLGVFVEGEMKRIVFKEDTVKNALFQKYGKSYIAEGYTIAQPFDIAYGTSSLDFANKTLTVPIHGTITYTFGTDKDTLINEFKGKDEAELKRIIFSLPGIENATVSLWPFWVTSVPKNEKRIHVEVQ